MRPTMLVAALLAASLPAAPARAETVTIKLATLAPEGSSWHEALKDLAQRWSQLSAGRVQLKIYAGGVAGDETAVTSKMRIGQFGAALITAHGLVSITDYVRAFGLPRMVRSYEELDHALLRLKPEIERRLEEKGFVVLELADAGMVRLFLPEPTTAVDRVRSFKMFTWAGEAEGPKLWARAGFRVVPLAATDVMAGLQTKLIESIPTTPSIALASQWYTHLACLMDMPIAPLVGALVLTKRDWERIPAEVRASLREEAARIVLRMREENRRREREAISAMEKRGMKVVVPSGDDLRAWNAIADEVNRAGRGEYAPADAYDDLKRAVEELRTVTRASRPGAER